MEKVADQGEIPLKVRILDLLLEKKPDVNIQDSFGNTPLHYCVDIPSARKLLEKGADIFIRNERNQTPREKNIEWDFTRDTSDWLYLKEEMEIEKRRREKEKLPESALLRSPPEPLDLMECKNVNNPWSRIEELGA